MASLTNAELEERIALLEAENQALRKHVPLRAKRERAWGWTLLAVVLIVLGTMLAPIAVVSSWAKTELTNTDNFVATFAPLVRDPDVQDFITEQSVAAINANLDIPALTSDVIDGITALGTGPRATEALNALKGPAAAGLQTLVSNLVSNFVKSDTFAGVWSQALRTSHTQLLKTLQSDPNAVVISGTNDSIGIQLGPIVERLKTVLVDRGLTLAARIPAVDKTIVVANSDSLRLAQTLYPLATAAGAWLPWIALLLLAAGVVVARRRALALVWAAVALALSMVVLSAGLGIGRIYFLNAVSSVVPRAAAGDIYDQVVLGMRDTALAVAVLGIVVAVVAWVAGPFRLARRLRALASSGFAWIRGAAARHGITTGRVGEWMYGQRVLLRVLIAIIGAVVVLFVRPLTPALILWTLVLAVIAIGILELLQRPPARLPDAAVAADEQTVPSNGRPLAP